MTSTPNLQLARAYISLQKLSKSGRNPETLLNAVNKKKLQIMSKRFGAYIPSQVPCKSYAMKGKNTCKMFTSDLPKVREEENKSILVLFQVHFNIHLPQRIIQKLDNFQTRCLRRILKIFQPNKISNKELFKTTQTADISDQIKEKNDGSGLAIS